MCSGKAEVVCISFCLSCVVENWLEKVKLSFPTFLDLEKAHDITDRESLCKVLSM